MSKIFTIPAPSAAITADELHSVACVYDCLQSMLDGLWDRIEAGATVDSSDYVLLSRFTLNRAVRPSVGAKVATQS